MPLVVDAMTTGCPKISYLTVTISTEGIAEMDGSTRAVFIPKTDIQSIELMSGTGAENPEIQALFGLALIVGGLLGLESVWVWFTQGGTLSKVHLGLVIFMFVGVWLLVEACRKRIYLLVTSRSDTRKIVFRGVVDAQKMSEFITSANRDFGYQVQLRLQDARET